MSLPITSSEHALFSPSQPSWINYNDEQMIEAFKNSHRAELGTEIHEWSSIQIQYRSLVSNLKEIEKGVKTHIHDKYIRDQFSDKSRDYGAELIKHMDYLPKETYPTVKSFINDSIGFGMKSEDRVEYSKYYFGTADAIRYDTQSKTLRVFDLKTGTRPAKISQLYTYAALYCLQHDLKPDGITFETRIYQSGDILTDNPPTELIYDLMRTIVHGDAIINKFIGGKS